MKRLSFLVVLAIFAVSVSLALAAEPPKVPTIGKVTLAQFGSKGCMPCRLMQSTIDELTVEYKGKAAIVDVDVQRNEELARRFAIRATPTQIFFDASGVVVAKHEGYLDKKTLVHVLNRLGVK